MLEWIKKTTPVDETRGIRHRPFYLRKFNFEQPPSSINEIALFFLAGSVILDESMMLSLYAKSDSVQKTIMNDIAPHFEDVKIVYVENEIEIINMQQIKCKSVLLFNKSDSEVIEIIKDLYRTNDMSVWKPEGIRETSHYAVNKEKLDKRNCSVFVELQRFITEAYMDIGEPLVLFPTGWNLEDGLIKSPFLVFMASFVPIITLLVDDSNNQVVAVKLSSK